jgi:cytochrome c oxidase cbb3-type subunit 3
MAARERGTLKKLSVPIFVAVAAVAAAQQQPAPPQQQPPPPQQQPPPAPTAPAGGRGQGRGRPAVFPAQQRPPGDPALIERGKTLYAVTCSACHGVDLRGGQLGGPNLLRSQLMLNDQHGELLLPVIRGSRAEKGMPPIPMSDDDVKAVAEFIHSVMAASRGQGAPPGGDTPPPDPVVGDAAAGQAYFAARCGSCHSATGDLQGIATRVPDPRMLQNLWVSGGGGRGGWGGRGAAAPTATVTVALPSGEKLEGELVRIDDFVVTVKQADGSVRSVRRDGDLPKVTIQDPLEPHRALLTVYTDKDMHDVTAYLVTLK